MESLTILKNKVLESHQNYRALRELGMEHIRNLSGKIWTDHNLHDPGITLLEILCYALTDLGLRTSFDIKDLMTGPEGQTFDPKITSFFPAQDILTTTPLTLDDYRTLLIRVEGIRNAWLIPITPGVSAEQETPVYIDCARGKLTDEPLSVTATPNKQLHISGLYKVLLELEIDPELGSLNETHLIYTIPSGPLKGIRIGLDAEDEDFIKGKMEISGEFSRAAVNSIATQGENTFILQVTFNPNKENKVKFQKFVIRVLYKPYEMKDVSVTTGRIQKVVEEGNPFEAALFFWKKQLKIRRTLDFACCVLHAHRNLCEDYSDIRQVKPERVAVCVDIEVKSDADIERVQAEVYLAIEHYFNPPIPYFSLQELLQKGWPTEDIFNGPHIDFELECAGEPVFTKPGFVKRKDLEASQLRKTLQTSDIINKLMDIKEIVSIKDLHLQKYDNGGKKTEDSEPWCMTVSEDHQPILFIEKSKILFYKNGLPFEARFREFAATLDHLRAASRKEVYVEPPQTLSLPVGTYRQVEDHYSIQHDFPQTYHIGQEGLSKTASPERVMQARQLKGYLIFYDQILADYLAQLAHFPKLFSLDPAISRTYFSQFLKNIAGTTQSFETEFYTDLQEVLDLEGQWKLSEDDTSFHDRRNRVLDHLMARFAEQFTNYVLLMNSRRHNGRTGKPDNELIADKIQFLTEYPEISRERNKAFNYRPQSNSEIWDTDNVSGAQKRISRLTGIDSYERRNLDCPELLDVLFTTSKSGAQFLLKIKDSSSQQIFKSREKFPSREAAMAKAKIIFSVFQDEKTATIQQRPSDGKYVLFFKKGSTQLTHDRLFDSQVEASAIWHAVQERYRDLLTGRSPGGSEKILCNKEGFFLIEHILLRPFQEGDTLMDICLGPDCEGCGDEDPYSFRVSIVLPYWPTGFQDREFRRFFERTLREQIPAHILVKICWINNDQMADFQKRYKTWLKEKSRKIAVPAKLKTASRNLIKALQGLRSHHPEARLHDCLEGEEGEAIRLENTNLGNF